MQWLTISRSTVLGLLSAAGLLACGNSSTPTSTSDNSVDAAYSALVSEAANCGKQVKSCLEAAGTDRAAIGSCREQFGSCRVDAGKQALNALASAVRDCTSHQNQCVHAGGHGEAGSCEGELRVCLRAAHAANHEDDADAGDDDKGGKPSDCLDELHSCVKGNGAALVCAEKVRSCVVDCIPNASDVVPDDAAEGHEKGKDPQTGDAGMRGGKLSAARMCVDELGTCMDSGGAPRSCAKTLMDCHEAAQP